MSPDCFYLGIISFMVRSGSGRVELGGGIGV